MNRRRLLQLSVLAALGQSVGAREGEKPAGSLKKGLGITHRLDEWSGKLSQLRCKWFYSWGAAVPAGAPEGIQFTPMIWGYHGKNEPITAAGKAAKAAGINELLGFNEPDQKKQADLTVETALDAWPALMETGLRLGSPGCVHPDREWMKAFMAGAKTRKLRVDFVCIHSYGGTEPAAFIKRLHAIHELYGKPIWITELGVGDWTAKTVAENKHKPAKVLRFMESVLPQLEKLDFIERYAWFPAGHDEPALGTSALFDAAGKLTPLGECYRDA